MANGKYKFKGRVVAVGKTEALGRDPSKPFYKRMLVLDDADEGAKYPNPVPFEATGDKCRDLDACRVGATVEVTFFLNGREWKDKQGQVRWFGANRIAEVSAGVAVPEIPMRDSAADPEPTGDDVDMPF
jgi:hypothetical protein